MSKKCFGTFGTRRKCFSCESKNNCISDKVSGKRKEFYELDKENPEVPEKEQ